MNRAEKILDLIEAEDYGKAYPGRNSHEKPGWSRDPFHILIATVLSQRTRDQNTFLSSTRLFSEYDTPKEIAAAPLEEIEELIRVSGFPSVKAKAIKEISRRLHEDFNDEVPRDIEILLGFPMVGRKTANCVMAYAFEIDAICVDTHVHRIANRIGLVSTRNPDQTESALMEVIPQHRWKDINSLMVVFGQEICKPMGPKCMECPVRRYCDYFKSTNGPKR